nr:hypothetical protein EgrG_002023300 [Echinococcus granulosus]
MCLIFAFVAAFLFFFVTGYGNWNCGDRILSAKCHRYPESKVTGGLLLTAGLVVLIDSFVLSILLVCDNSCSRIAACVFAVISTVLSFTGITYYPDMRKM